SSSIRPLLAHALRHWRLYLLGFASLAAVDFINSWVLTWLVGIPFDKVEHEARGGEVHTTTFMLVGLAYVGISIAQMGLRYLWRWCFMGGAERIAFEIRRAFFEKIQRLPIAFFDRAKTGDLMSRATNDLDNVRGALGMGALMAFDCACYFIMVPARLLSISPRLSLVLLGCVVVLPYAFYKVGKIVHLRSKKVQDIFG